MVLSRLPAAEDDMKVLRLCLAVAIFSGITTAATAQETASAPAIQNTVSVTASKSQQLRAGDHFSFLLEFNKALEKHTGKLTARFEKEPGGPPARIMSPYGEEKSYSAVADIQDGQKIYNMSLPIDTYMSPGRWKLVDVSVGGLSPATIPVSQDISFVIPELSPMVIHLHAPKGVEAGNSYVLTVTLDKYPTDLEENCILRLQPLVNLTSPRGAPIEFESVKLAPDQLSYKFSHLLKPDFPRSSWKGEIRLTGALGDSRYPCQYPELRGDLQFAFDVEPNKEIVTPTSVVVTVNPSQIQLLVAEADRLRAKAQHLKELISSNNATANQALLQNNLLGALKDLDKTESSFKQKGAETSSRDVTIFFDDIRRTYAAALKIANSPSLVLQTEPRLIAAKAEPDTPLNAASEAAVASIERNVSAYDVVVSTKMITFTLSVYSSPDHAAIFYKRDGDDEYQPVEHDTDWKIEKIPRAFYYVRLEKKGCETQEKPFDAMKNADPSIHITLKCKRAAQ
jgi:hypothetical protein